MASLKQLALREEERPRFTGGHSLCAGCGIPTIVRTVLDSIPGPVVAVSATGCLEVATTRYPFTAWGVPWLHVAFENAAAVASGVEAAYRALAQRGRLSGERVTIVVFAGDGGTYDIGLQALSGALERGHRFLYVCYDNEAYMNTGIQRSGATPFAASTTTSPVGSVGRGKAEVRKDMTAIVVAHHIPYAAQASTSHWQDLSVKVERAVAQEGPSFLNILSTCPPGWGHEARDGARLARLAVESRYAPATGSPATRGTPHLPAGWRSPAYAAAAGDPGHGGYGGGWSAGGSDWRVTTDPAMSKKSGAVRGMSFCRYRLPPST